MVDGGRATCTIHSTTASLSCFQVHSLHTSRRQCALLSAYGTQLLLTRCHCQQDAWFEMELHRAMLIGTPVTDEAVVYMCSNQGH